MRHEDIFASSRAIRAKSQFLAKGGPAKDIYFLHSGICIGYDLLADGRRQIVSVHLGGGVINPTTLYNGRISQNFAAMTDLVVGTRGVKELDSLVRADHEVGAWMLEEILRQHAILEIWVCALGRKSALERMALFFCEAAVRLGHEAGEDTARQIQLNQADLADILGLSVVHVNRVLRSLREMQLADFENGWLKVHDFARLAAIAEFEDAYLHRRRPE